MSNNAQDMTTHIRYEVLKLLAFLRNGNLWVYDIDGLPEGAADFAAESMLEAALIHARCVAEFLRRNDVQTDTVTARDFVKWHWHDGEPLKDDLAEIHGRVAHLGWIRLTVQRNDAAFRWDNYLGGTAVPLILRGFRDFLNRLDSHALDLFNQPTPKEARIDLIQEITAQIGP